METDERQKRANRSQTLPQILVNTLFYARPKCAS